MDREDPLASYRSQFLIPQNKDGSEVIYFCGNSLGLQPKMAQESIQDVLEDWATKGVDSHFEGKRPWIGYHENLSQQMARLVGALTHEVTLMNTLTVNLHLMLVSFYQPTGRRHKILIESDAFPSDRYAIQSQLNWHGYRDSLLELRPRPGEILLRNEDILDYLFNHGDEIELVLLGCPNYYTGQVYAIDEITSMAQQKGCKVGFDLAHGVGNIPFNLHDANVDFAVWCTYKYLNGGPGSIAGCFIHEKHAHDQNLPRFAGWWGQNHETRFLMPDHFDPVPGIEGWQISNIPILSMAPLRASLNLFDAAGMTTLRLKSIKLTGLLESLINSIHDDRISILTPTEQDARGCQLSIRVEDVGKSLFDLISKRNVTVDWREPDVIRVAPVPLYNTYSEVLAFAEILEECLAKI